MKKFVARHPIFDREQSLFGYELLFRSGLESYFHDEQADRATSKLVVDSFLLFGMGTLTGGHKAFINFPHKLLADQYVTLLPPDQLVVEVLEDVEPDAKVVAACEALKKKGYLIALDDFTPAGKQKPLIPLADFIKVDFLAHPPAMQRRLANEYGGRGIKMIAEKIETREQFFEAFDMGYSLFQGFFFSRPEVFSGKDVPAFKTNYLSVLRVINHREPDFTVLERVIKQEASLCYKLLRYLNSAYFDFRGEITSIGHALSLLGLLEMRKWISLVALAGMGEDRPAALVIGSIVRARFCEALAPMLGMSDRSNDLFLMGLLSMMEAILERPMKEILHELPISTQIKEALLGERNVFWAIFQLIVAYERGDWARTTKVASVLKLQEGPIAEAYIQSVKWAHQIFQIHEAQEALETA